MALLQISEPGQSTAPHQHRHRFVAWQLWRQIAQLGGNVTPFVHPLVEQRLSEKISRS